MRSEVTNVKPMVSVLLPVYNAQETVARAIQSILRQTFQEFELLVINDGSRDGSLEVVKRFRDPRIRVIDLTRNGGLVAALIKRTAYESSFDFQRRRNIKTPG